MAVKKKRRPRVSARSEWRHIEAAGLSMLKQAAELRGRVTKTGDATGETLVLLVLAVAWNVIGVARLQLASGKAVR